MQGTQGYQVRIEPNKEQQKKMFRCIGATRWVYNWALERQRENYDSLPNSETVIGGKHLKAGTLNTMLTELKHNNEQYAWLQQIPYFSLNQAIREQERAYKRFFSKQSKFPRFKSRKSSNQSFALKPESFKVGYSTVIVPGIGKVKLSEKERIPWGRAKYGNPKVKYDGVHWYISCSLEKEFADYETSDEVLGIDLGISCTMVTSKGEAYGNINKTSTHIKQLKKRLHHLQRKISKKYEMNREGNKYIKTKNIIKLEKEIRKVHNSLTNIRKDFQHKLTTQMVRTKPFSIVMENLNVKGMMKNRHLSKAIAEQSFYELKRMITYKSNRRGIRVVEVPTMYPSSKTCSHCGEIKHNLKLSDRTFICPHCGYELNRDYNAALNLSNYIIKKGKAV